MMTPRAPVALLPAILILCACGGPARPQPPADRRPAFTGSALHALSAGRLEGKIPDLPELPRIETERFPAAPPRSPAATPEAARARALADLRSGHPHHRYLAAREAGALGIHEAVPLLARLAASEDPAALPSIAALGEIGGKAGAKALGRLLKGSRFPSLDEAIVRALGRTRAAEAVRPLALAASDRRLAIRLEAVAALGSLGEPEAAKQLRGVLDSAGRMPLERAMAAASLFLMGDGRAFAFLERAASAPDASLQLVALRAMAAALDPTSDIEPSTRAIAARSMASALGSSYEDVWHEAGLHLLQHESEVARHVVEALRSASPDVALRAELVLASWRGGDTGGHVARAVAWPHPRTRMFACRVVEGLDPREAIRHLRTAISDNHAGVRFAAIHALTGVGGESAREALSLALASGDATTRLHAERALAQLGRKPQRAGSAFTLEQIFVGADRRRFCVIRGPDGERTLLAEGDLLGPYTVRRIQKDADGKGKVVMSRGDETVELVLTSPGGKDS